MADRLKKCVDGVQSVLKEYKLPLHEEELRALRMLADTFMASTKDALESMREPLEKASNDFFKKKFRGKKSN